MEFNGSFLFNESNRINSFKNENQKLIIPNSAIEASTTYNFLSLSLMVTVAVLWRGATV